MTEDTLKLATRIVETRDGDIPDDVRHEAVRLMLNISGCMVHGACNEEIRRLAAGLDVERTGSGSSAALPADPMTLAFFLGASSSISAWDDGHLDSLVHPSGPAVVAAIVLGRRLGAAGEKLISAIALGVETTCRVANAMTLGGKSTGLGWSLTGLTGGIGAAVTAAKMFELDARQTAAAIGMAASQSGGLRATHGTGATALLTGNGAQLGLRAAMLARSGYSGPLDVFEHKFGFLSMFSPPSNAAALVEGFGADYHIRRIVHKIHPCGIVLYPSIEAAEILREEKNIDHSCIEKVEVSVSDEAWRICDRPLPTNEMERQLSAQYWLGRILAEPLANLPQTDEAAGMSTIKDLALRVQVAADASLRNDESRVTISMRDGAVFQKKCIGLRGGPDRPLSDADVVHKFRAQVHGKVDGADADRFIEDILNIDSAPKCSNVLDRIVNITLSIIDIPI